MNYFRSENLKFKHTILNKLLFICPILTVMFSWLGGGYVNSQYMSIYFWYTCMLPGLIALMCSLSNKKEKQFTSYYIKISLPINLKKFWISKNIIIALKSI